MTAVLKLQVDEVDIPGVGEVEGAVVELRDDEVKSTR